MKEKDAQNWLYKGKPSKKYVLEKWWKVICIYSLFVLYSFHQNDYGEER